jgi:hypothetical protein
MKARAKMAVSFEEQRSNAPNSAGAREARISILSVEFESELPPSLPRPQTSPQVQQSQAISKSSKFFLFRRTRGVAL